MPLQLHQSLNSPFFLLFFFNDTPTTEIYTLSLHDALPISTVALVVVLANWLATSRQVARLERAVEARSEEHTSELQSRFDLVCRLLLEKKKKKNQYNSIYTVPLCTNTFYSV